VEGSCAAILGGRRLPSYSRCLTHCSHREVKPVATPVTGFGGAATVQRATRKLNLGVPPSVRVNARNRLHRLADMQRIRPFCRSG